MRHLLLLFLPVAQMWGACAGNFHGTPCTATVGTVSRDYTTPQAAINDIPANLVTDGNSYVVWLYNDAEFTGTIGISGKTTNATHTITLTAAPGQSFADHPNVRTNALKYNQANGVGIRVNADYGVVIQISNTSYVTISRLQIKNTGTSSAGAIGVAGAGVDYITFRDLIADGMRTPGYAVVQTYGYYSTIANVLVVMRGSGYGISTTGAYGAFIGCTVVVPAELSVTATAFYSGGGTVLQSSAAFGPGLPASASGWDTVNSKNNATNKASGFPGTGNQYNVAYGNNTPFLEARSNQAGFDLRPAAATALASGGYKDATVAPNDITGTVRPSAPTIGVWELAVGVVTAAPRRRITQ